MVDQKRGTIRVVHLHRNDLDELCAPVRGDDVSLHPVATRRVRHGLMAVKLPGVSVRGDYEHILSAYLAKEPFDDTFVDNEVVGFEGGGFAGDAQDSLCAVQLYEIATPLPANGLYHDFDRTDFE